MHQRRAGPVYELVFSTLLKNYKTPRRSKTPNPTVILQVFQISKADGLRNQLLMGKGHWSLLVWDFCFQRDRRSCKEHAFLLALLIHSICTDHFQKTIAKRASRCSLHVAYCIIFIHQLFVRHRKFQLVIGKGRFVRGWEFHQFFCGFRFLCQIIIHGGF